MNILDLFAHIGLKADTGPANDFLKSIGGIKGALVGAIGGTLSLAKAVQEVNKSFSDTLSMKKFADDTGASVQEMQKWKQVADQVNGSGEGVAASIRAITQNQEKIKLGQGNISGYQLLGIDPRSDPFKVLEALRTKTQGMTQGMRRNIASQFGVSNDLVATLELTNDQFDRMAGRTYIVSPASIAAVNQARGAVTELGNRLNYLRNEAVAKLAPYIIKGVTWLQKIISFGERIVHIVDSFVRSSIGWKNAVIGVAAAFAILNAAVALPMAGILALFLILDDLYVYSKHGKGKSIFGEMVKEFPLLGKMFDSAFGGIKDVLAAVNGFINQDWSKFDNAVDKWGSFGAVLKTVSGFLEIVASSLETVYNLMTGNEAGTEKAFKGVQGSSARSVKGIEDLTKSIFGEDLGKTILKFVGTDKIKAYLEKQSKSDIATAPAARSAASSSTSTTTINDNRKVSVEVSGTTDPKAVGEEVVRVQGEQFKNTRTPYANGKAEK